MKLLEVQELLGAINQIGKLKSAPKAVYGLARNFARLRSLMKPVEEARKTIWADHFGEDGEIKPGDERVPAFQKEFNEVLEEEVEFEPYTFTLEMLNLDENEMDPKLLGLIMPLIADG